MTTARSTRIPAGALVLGAAASLLAIFPLLRPFFVLDVFEPERSPGA